GGGPDRQGFEAGYFRGGHRFRRDQAAELRQRGRQRHGPDRAALREGRRQGKEGPAAGAVGERTVVRRRGAGEGYSHRQPNRRLSFGSRFENRTGTIEQQPRGFGARQT